MPSQNSIRSARVSRGTIVRLIDLLNLVKVWDLVHNKSFFGRSVQAKIVGSPVCSSQSAGPGHFHRYTNVVFRLDCKLSEVGFSVSRSSGCLLTIMKTPVCMGHIVELHF